MGTACRVLFHVTSAILNNSLNLLVVDRLNRRVDA